MNDNAPLTTGIITVSALFGVLALLVAWLLLSFGFFGSLVIGVIVAVIVAVILMWRARNEADQASGVAPLGAPRTNAAPTSTGPAPTTKAASASPVATTAATATPPATAAEVKASNELPSQSDMGGRKGERKHEGDAAAKPAAKAAAMPAAKPKATAKPKAAAKPAATAKPAAAPKPAAAAKPKAAAKPMAADGKPEMLTKARAGGADDLKEIKGVGPKMETMLNKMGVYHFDQVASWRKKEVEWVDENLEGFKGRVTRDEWVKQAKVLAKGSAS